MQKAKLRIIEKHIENCQLREILIMLLLPNSLSGNENHQFLIEPQQKGERYATRK
jgi:hypothetical protein